MLNHGSVGWNRRYGYFLCSQVFSYTSSVVALPLPIFLNCVGQSSLEQVSISRELENYLTIFISYKKSVSFSAGHLAIE